MREDERDEILGEIGKYTALAGQSISIVERIVQLFRPRPEVKARILRRRAAIQNVNAGIARRRGRLARADRLAARAANNWREAQALHPIDAVLAARQDAAETGET